MLLLFNRRMFYSDSLAWLTAAVLPAVAAIAILIAAIEPHDHCKAVVVLLHVIDHIIASLAVQPLCDPFLRCTAHSTCPSPLADWTPSEKVPLLQAEPHKWWHEELPRPARECLPDRMRRPR